MNHSLKILIPLSTLVSLMACTPGAIEVEETAASAQADGEPTVGETENPEVPATPTSPAIPTLLTPPEGQLLLNADFESGTENWEPRYGDFLPTREDSHTGVGSGRLMTSSVDARGDYIALIGQCVPVTGGTVPLGESGTARLGVTVHINASPGGTYINISGVFTDDERCRGTQVGTFSIPVDHGDGWFVVNDVIDVPIGAGSLDFLISCSGSGPDSSILVDDVHLIPHDLP